MIKKAGKMILRIVLCAAVLIAAVLVWLSLRPAVPKNFTEKVSTGGVLEARYLQNGTFDVSYKESRVLQNFSKYEIWYPTDMESKDAAYPVILVANGTGVKASKYPALMEHLASWGFVVMATEEAYSWNGFGLEMCLRLAIEMNGQKQVLDWDSNPFFGKLDLDHIGVFGHSQGGVGAINAAGAIEHASMVKAVFAASPTQPSLAEALEWYYDAGKLSVPTFLMAGTGETDSNTVCPLEGLQQIYDSIPDTVPKVMCRRNDGDHSQMLYYGAGYMTAWFLYWLSDDDQAKEAFFGENAELLSNPLYQDIRVNP